MARPTIYSQALADAVCERLVDGESLRKICRRADMPSAGTVCRWLADDAHPGFRQQYARAREAQADTYADEAAYIADTPKMGVMTTTEEITVDGVKGTKTKTRRGDMLGHRRLQVDIRKWIAARQNPKKWGDRLELGGEVGLKRVSFEPISEDEWEAQHTPA